MSAQVTILIPNYKTPQLTKLCMRLIRKHTDFHQAKCIVIDNDSADESLTYLRQLKWIELIERPAVPGETPPQAHSRALDTALNKVTTPYVLSIHTDTLIKNNQWLNFLITKIESSPNIAGVGSWKLESKTPWQSTIKFIEKIFQLAYFKATKKSHTIEGIDENFYYLRSHCALYRTDLLKKYNLHFSDGDATAGKMMHKRLVDEGHEMIFLPSETLIHYLDHINHATAVLNPQLGIQKKAITKGLRRIQKNLQELNAQQILDDPQWDN